MDQRGSERCDSTRCGSLDWMLEQKEGLSGKTGNTQWPCPSVDVSREDHITGSEDVNNGKTGGGAYKDSVLSVQLCSKPKFVPKHKMY